MIFAAPGDTGYDVMLVAHIALVIVGLAPMFVHPFLARQLTQAENPAVVGVLDRMTRNGRMIYTPAIVLGGLMGFGVAGMSDEVIKMSDSWVMGGFWVWIAMIGVYHGLMIPAEKAMARGEAAAMKRLDLGGGLVAVLLVVQLYLMVFKPGADL